MEEERSEEVEKYIEELGGVPETLLSIGMIGPIILSIVGLVPQLMSVTWAPSCRFPTQPSSVRW